MTHSIGVQTPLGRSFPPSLCTHLPSSVNVETGEGSQFGLCGWTLGVCNYEEHQPAVAIGR